MKVKFKLTHPDAKLPNQAKLGDAGFDLCCVESFKLLPGETKMVDTGLQLASCPETIKDSCIFLQLLSRSGLASKGIFVLGGIVDTSYRGNIKVLLHNGNSTHAHETTEFQIGPNQLSSVKKFVVTDPVIFNIGDRIAQLVIQQIVTNITSSTCNIEFESTNTVEATSRGSGGFGSTGV